MDQYELEQKLKGLELGQIKYFDVIGSTNDAASRWLQEGAADLSLVVANEQTTGRGRAGRRWFTPPGSALAFSLIIKDQGFDLQTRLKLLPRYTGLGALATCDYLQSKLKLSPQIKWPNDVLVAEQKIAGVLVDASWIGNSLVGFVLGIGLNIYQTSVPPAEELDFPAISVEDCLLKPYPVTIKHPIDFSRSEMLRSILGRLLDWRTKLMLPEFIQTWEKKLAYLGEWVIISDPEYGEPQSSGRLLGLGQDGSARIQDISGNVIHFHAGNLRLRRMDDFDQGT